MPEVAEAFFEIPCSARGHLALQKTVKFDPGLATNTAALAQEFPTHFLELGGKRFASEPRALRSTNLVHRLVQMLHNVKPVEDMKGTSGFGGGVFGTGTFSTFNAPKRADPEVATSPVPACRVDNLLIKKDCTFYFGAYLDIGRVTCLDSRIGIGNDAYADGLWDTVIDQITLILDKAGANPGISFNGADGVTSANQSIRDIRIKKIVGFVTKDAKAAGRAIGGGVSWYGSLGPRITIDEISGDFGVPPGPSGAWSSNAPRFKKVNLELLSTYSSSQQNIQTTPALAYLGPQMSVITTGAGLYPFQLPAAAIEGEELTLINSGPGMPWIDGNAAGGSGSNLRDLAGPIFLSLYGYIKFRAENSFWQVASGGSRGFTSTVANLPAASAVLQGVKAYVTDANATFTAGIGAVVAAGGANKVPVVCDGTNWRIG